MLPYFQPQAVVYALAGLCLLFLMGYWAAALLYKDRSLAEIWMAGPAIGGLVFTVGLANLNYLGVPVRFGAPLVACMATAASLAVCVRRGGLPAPKRGLNWCAGWIAVLACLAFLAPYAITGGFYPYFDAVYYAAPADFVRIHPYFFRPADMRHYPWLGINPGVARMGAQYLLSGVGALLGLDSARAFMPTTAIALTLDCCAFWLLVRALARSELAALAGVALYAGNVTFVYRVAAGNFLAQTVGMGALYLLLSLAIEGLWGPRQRILAALAMAGMVSIYPELFAIAAVPIGVITVWELWKRETSVTQALSRWTQILGIAFVLNPYTWSRSLDVLATEYRNTTLGFGLNLIPSSWAPVDLFFGVSGPVPFSNPVAAIGAKLLGLTLLGTAVWGVARMAPKIRAAVAFSAVTYAALVLWELHVRHFTYASQKVESYCFYLAPAALACGMAELARLRSKAWRSALAWQAGLWLCFAGFALAQMAVTNDTWTPYPQSLHEGERWNVISELAHAEHLAPPGGTTLVACRPDEIARWIPYFYRRPIGDLFPSIYYAGLARKGAAWEPYRYFLLYRPDAVWRADSPEFFRNSLFSLIPAQTAVIFSFDGWHSSEPFGGKYGHWMTQQGRLLAAAPVPDTITLVADVRAVDAQPRHLRYILNGRQIGAAIVGPGETRIETPELHLPAGLNELLFQTDEAAHPIETDSRPLNLWFGDLRIRQLAPSFLDAARAADAALIERLTEDRWVTDSGVRILFRNPGAASIGLEIRGMAMDRAVPGSIQVRAGDGPPANIVLDRDGAFVGRVQLRVNADGNGIPVTILPAKTARPSDTGASQDSRRLGFRLSSIRVEAAPR